MKIAERTIRGVSGTAKEARTRPGEQGGVRQSCVLSSVRDRPFGVIPATAIT